MLTLPLQKLPTSARPPEVAQWIKRHVNKKHDPVTVSTDYPSCFVAWWNAIQPAWRIKPNGLLSREAPAREAWTSLKKGGSAGLYVVVMALSWWICKLEAGSDELWAWDIVDDVTWVLSSVMLAPPPSGVKRALPDAADAESGDGSPPSKCVTITTSRLTYLFSDVSRLRHETDPCKIPHHLPFLPLLSYVTYYAFRHVLIVTAPCFHFVFKFFYTPSSLYNPL